MCSRARDRETSTLAKGTGGGQTISQTEERVNKNHKGYVTNVYTVAQKGNRRGDSRQLETNAFSSHTTGSRVRAGRFVSSGSRP